MRAVKYVVLAAVLVSGGVYFVKHRKATNGEEEPVYQTEKVERTDLRMTVSGSGVLQPLTTVEVKANVAGEITKLLVDTGDVVKAGQLLATIDPTESDSSYRQAAADVQAANARVGEAKANLKLQDLSTPLQISVSDESVKSAVAREQQAATTLDIQRQTNVAQVEQAEQSLAAAKARLAAAERTAATQPALTKAAVEQAEATLHTNQESLNELKNATQPRARAQSQASLRQAQVSLANAKLDLKRQQELQGKGFVPARNVTDAQAAVDGAQASVDSAKAALDSLDAEHKAQLKAAEARVVQAQAALGSAKANAVKDELTKQDAEAARAAVKQAEAAVAAARANTQEDQVREAELAAARAATRQSRQNLKLANTEKMQSAVRGHQVAAAQAQTVRSQAQLENAAKAVRDTTVYAPRDGVVVEKFVEEGSIITSGRSAISAGTNIVTIADITQMFVLADVDEVDIGSMRIGQKVDLAVESFSDEYFSGKVSKVYPKGVDQQNVTVFKVEIALDFTAPRLRPGMTAEATIVIDEKRGVIAVPNSAIVEQDGKKSVQMMVDGQPQYRDVQTGLANYEQTEILSGLKEGEEIVTLAVVPRDINAEGKGDGKGGGKGDSQRNMRRMMRTVSPRR